MSIAIDRNHDDDGLMSLAHRLGPVVYDTAYLEVALRRGLPMASFDQQLRQAAAACCIPLVV